MKNNSIRRPQPINLNHQKWGCNGHHTPLQLLATLHESIPCIAFTLNSKGLILSISRFGATYLGYKPIELRGTFIHKLFYGEDQDNYKFQLAELPTHSPPIRQWDARLIHKTGKLLSVKALLSTVIGSELDPIFNLICEDNCRLKQVEERLQQFDDLYRNTLTYIAECHEAENELKQDRDDLESRVRERTTELMQTNEQLQQEILERQRAESELLKTQGRLQQLLASSPTIIYSCQAFGDYATIFVSQNVTAQLGYSPEEFLADSRFWIDHVHPDDVASVSSHLKEVLAQDYDRKEYRFRHKNGSYRWLRDEMRLVKNSTHEVVEIVGSWQDITEQKGTEASLKQQFLREHLIRAIAGRIHKSLNLEEILNTTVAEVRQVLKSDRVIIFHLHEDGSGVVVVESVGSGWKPISGTLINDRYFADSYVQLYQQGRVQVVENIHQAGLTPCHVELLAQFEVKANLVVPIIQESSELNQTGSNSKLWGLLVAQQCQATRQWQPWEIELLKSIATHTAIAIHQSELYQQAHTELAQRQQVEAELRQSLMREQLVRAIAQRIRQSLNLDEILERTVAEVRQILGCDRVLLYRIWPNGTGSAVTEAVVTGWPAILGQTFPEEVFPPESQHRYSQGRVLAIHNIETENVLPCLVEFVEQFGVKAKLVVPILEETTELDTALQPPTLKTPTLKPPTQHSKLWGLLVAHQCSHPRQWQQTEIDLLQSLATQVAIAIQHSQLYEEAKSKARREQALNQVTQVIRSSLDLTTIFSTAVREIGSLLQVDRAEIVQYISERKVWLCVSEYHKSEHLSLSIGKEISDENNPIAERLKALEIVQIDDSDQLDLSIQPCSTKHVYGGWLLVPLNCGSSFWGALGLVMNRASYHWQESEVKLIRAVGDQLAIALQQAELYQQSRLAEAKALSQAQQLEDAFVKLQKTQAQLVQTEKMSSLGQLVAGVAHEINNPVNFIYGNLIHASDYAQDLLKLLQLYQQECPNPKPAIIEEITAIDLEFLMEDLPKLLDSMKVGAERISEIVRSLRHFSRVAEAEIKPVDIHEGLDSTLMILQNRLKSRGNHPGIQVIKEYGNLPDVECYAGQLNQVFMNLLVNAVDAIDEQNQWRTLDDIQANPSTIRVQTNLVNNSQVIIRIIDNGPGMTDQVKQQLFDPFFTTKPVGMGTGLGLSISYQIVVEKHKGQLYFKSEVGQGTEFVVEIPLRQSSGVRSDRDEE